MYFPAPPGDPNRADSDPKPPTRKLSPEEEADLRAVVGPNADHYLRIWSRILTGRGTNTGFNRIAFFFPFIWLVYRRMYRIAIVLFVISFAVGVVNVIVCVVVFGTIQTPVLVEVVESFFLASICGGYANHWYLSHVRRIVTDVRRDLESESAVHKALIARGGTNSNGARWMAVVWILLYALSFSGRIASREAQKPVPYDPAAIRTRSR
jgi:hypothetical protein